MLVEIKKLNILNDGYNRKVFIDKMYVNVNHIISISDYNQVKDFLLLEQAQIAEKDNFSLLKIVTAGDIEEIIALGSSEDLFSSFSKTTKKVLLNE
tara:strand:+ start:255 stop:542 length:288 start_codon:yes stop_codon:yes gene_type:complete